MSVTGEFLRGVLDEYEEILTQNPGLRGRPCPINELTVSIERSLEDIRNIHHAIEWLEEVSQNEWSSEERGYHLYQLLRRLDFIFSEKSVVPYEYGTPQKGYITIGRRWWNCYARYTSETGKGPLDGSPFSVHSGFPHLRDVEYTAEEWLRNNENKEIIDRAFDPAIREGFLRVGLCSLSGRAKTQFAGTEVLDLSLGIYGFRAICVEYNHEGLSDTANADRNLGYVQELCGCIQWARDAKIHVLCLPELSVCADGRRALRLEVEKNSGDLCLVIPGSYHDPVEGKSSSWVNVAPIWLVTRDGIVELARFEKTEPFSMKTSKALEFSSISVAAKDAGKNECAELREHIQTGEMVRVLKTPVGVFGILICKDELAQPQVVRRCAMLTDHLLVISMNFSPTAWFWSKSEADARAYSVATFYVNAAQVVEPENSDTEMVFWNIPCRLPEDMRNCSKEKYYRKPPSLQAVTYIKLYQLPQDGRVYFEVKIPNDLLRS